MTSTFSGSTVLIGNITLANLTLTGLWNGEYVSNQDKKTESLNVNEIKAQTIRILETLNGVPVNNLLTTDEDNKTSAKCFSVQYLEVRTDVIVSGKVIEI